MLKHIVSSFNSYTMEEITTVKELNAWASQRGLMNDDLVNLRRVQLMADEITNQNENHGYVCSTCFHRFKDKNIFCGITELCTQTRKTINIRSVSLNSTEQTRFEGMREFIQGRDNMIRITTIFLRSSRLRHAIIQGFVSL